ncbi:MAG: M2 family metallopeptidase [Pseudomonadota bacterium]
MWLSCLFCVPYTLADTQRAAAAFVERVEQHYVEFGEYRARVAWLRATNINYDSNWLLEQVNAEDTRSRVAFAAEAAQFNDLKLTAELRRKLELIKLAPNLAVPQQPGAAARLAALNTRMATRYSTGRIQLDGQSVRRNDLESLMGEIRDPAKLAYIWHQWREVAKPMAGDYAAIVDISNAGARELGYPDTGSMWRLRYEMPADAFREELERLWLQIKPLYSALHCHVRARLNEHYGDEVVPLDQPLRADLLGNMWAQQWTNIYDLVAPPADTTGINLSATLKAQNYTPEAMVRLGEGFFSSLGFAPLPESFWQRSMLEQPAGRQVVCHASAWNLDGADDLRIKMCTKVNADDFYTVYHELGHNYYQRAYKHQSPLFRTGANSGFHEAIGDMIALSITPDYLRQVGLLDSVPDPDADISLLMRQALDKIAFMPFGLLLDQWRWQVFAGEVEAEDYNALWWQLRQQYQGVRPPTPRTPAHFDPGSKYHIANHVSYTRYFLAHVLQFQFHAAACRRAGWPAQQPLHRCSIYGSAEAGEAFGAMLGAGRARPWPETLEAFTGSRQIDGSAVREYFAPLAAYLAKENANRQCGWPES